MMSVRPREFDTSLGTFRLFLHWVVEGHARCPNRKQGEVRSMAAQTTRDSVPEQGRLFDSRSVEDELPIPDRYEVQSDLEAGTVTITDKVTRNRATTDLRLYGEIRRVLATLLPAERMTAAEKAAPVEVEPPSAHPPRPRVVARPAAPTRRPKAAKVAKPARRPSAPARPSSSAPDEGPVPEARGDTPPPWTTEDNIPGDGYVLQRAKDPAGIWGYEVRVGDRGIAWISAESPRRWVLHDPVHNRIEASVHRNLIGAMSRVIAVVLPKANELVGA